MMLGGIRRVRMQFPDVDDDPTTIIVKVLRGMGKTLVTDIAEVENISVSDSHATKIENGVYSKSAAVLVERTGGSIDGLVEHVLFTVKTVAANDVAALKLGRRIIDFLHAYCGGNKDMSGVSILGFEHFVFSRSPFINGYQVSASVDIIHNFDRLNFRMY